MSLKKFVDQENFMAKWFKRPEMDANNLTPENCKELSQRLASALSPEALTCDGELRGAKLNAKRAMLNKAVQDLEKLGYAVAEY